MTNTPVAPQQESATTGDGRGPSGMWWVAWRQHRFAILASLTLMAIAALALVVFRLVFAARIESWGGRDFPQCTALPAPGVGSHWGCNLYYLRKPLEGWWSAIQLTLMALPGVVGVFSAAAVFARERERRTDVFALTQTISRTQWYWTKCAVVIAPLVAGMVVVGLLTQWAADAYDPDMWPLLEWPAFPLFGIVPAILTVLAAGISLGISSLIRSTLPAVVVALGLTIAVAGGIGYLGYPVLVPHERVAYPMDVSSYSQLPLDALRLEDGWLGAEGQPQTFTDCPEPDGLDWENDPEGADRVSNRAYDACLEAQGITGRYTAYIDISQRTRLTLTLAGISFLLAGASLTFGSWRLRRRPL